MASDFAAMLHRWWGEAAALVAAVTPAEIAAGEERLQARRFLGVDNEIVLYQNDMVRKFKRVFLEVRRKAFQRGLARADRYIPMIKRIFRAEGLPEDLAYLAIVESNLNPRARSPKWAMGLWQFMPHTARHFGLTVSPWYDERLDPELSTTAAARYLHYLHDRFGNWELAMAAYNAGEGRVNRAIRQNRSQGAEEDFWNLPLPLQTRRYVPSFLAVALVYNDLEGHGFSPISPAPGSEIETAWGEYYTTLEEIAGRLGVSRATLAALNPAWKQGAIAPAHRGEVMLRLPKGYAGRLQATMAEAPFTPPSVVTHRVLPGENLSHIARLYGVRISDLLMTNEIFNRHFLRSGRKLIIPLTDGARERFASREI